MKANRWGLFLFILLGGAVFQLPAQQSEADRKLLADIRAKAEKGEARSQYEFGLAFSKGSLGVARDYTEAVKWLRKAAEQGLAEAQNGLGTAGLRECFVRRKPSPRCRISRAADAAEAKASPRQ